ncbi:MAG: hypothetical protein IJZ29_01940 [Clostridia bacterium]|nr:hypothetical protein [Clostridia bacterium]
MKKFTKCLACFALVACCLFGFAGCTTGGDLEAKYVAEQNKALSYHMKGDVLENFVNQTIEYSATNYEENPYEHTYKENPTDTETVTKWFNDESKTDLNVKFQRYGSGADTIIKVTQTIKSVYKEYYVEDELLKHEEYVTESNEVYMFGKVDGLLSPAYYAVHAYSEVEDGVENTDSAIEEYKQYYDDFEFTTALSNVVNECFEDYMAGFYSEEDIYAMLYMSPTYNEVNGGIALNFNFTMNNGNYDQEVSYTNFSVYSQQMSGNVTIKNGKFSSANESMKTTNYDVVNKIESKMEVEADITIKYSCDKLTMIVPSLTTTYNEGLNESGILTTINEIMYV